ncbi:DUF4238 domain-containing protein [Paenibacillus lautus]|uniref:DUF4238 domain-containing protein n=1 Tax=Paenibacillus lautus TaxID=1401 RepID=UPI003D2E0C3A
MKVSNHYVPQFYLRNFSSDKKSVGIYNLKHGRYVKAASIKKQACKDFLYGEDNQIEDLFMEIENSASRLIRSIKELQKVPPIESEDYHLLIVFMLLSEARNLKSADSFNNLIDIQMKTIMRMKMDHGEDFGFPPDFLEKTSLSASIPNLMPIQSTIESYPVLLDLKCCLVVNKTDRQFITSDNPLVRYNLMYIKRRYYLRGFGLGNMGIQLFYPISPELCICIYDDVLYDCVLENGNIVIRKARYIDEMNKLFYLNSYQTLFFSELTKESYIRKIVGSILHTNSNVEAEVRTFGTSDNKFIIYSQGWVNEFINLGMFTVNRKFINMPLPLHMAGPMRPYTEKYINSGGQ